MTKSKIFERQKVTAKAPLILAIQALVIFAPNLKPGFSKEVCIRESDGNITCGELISSPIEDTSSGANDQMSFTDSQYGISFQFHACYRSSKGLDCSIDIHNETDMSKTIVFPHRAVTLRDVNGNYYQSYLSSIAGGSWSGKIAPKSTVETRFLFQPDGHLSDQIRIFSVQYQVNFQGQKSFNWRNFSIN